MPGVALYNEVWLVGYIERVEVFGEWLLRIELENFIVLMTQSWGVSIHGDSLCVIALKDIAEIGMYEQYLRQSQKVENQQKY